MTRFTIPWHDAKPGETEEEEKMEEDCAAGASDAGMPAPKISDEIQARITEDLAYERAERERMTSKGPLTDPGNLYPEPMRHYHSEDSSSLCMP